MIRDPGYKNYTEEQIAEDAFAAEANEEEKQKPAKLSAVSDFVDGYHTVHWPNLIPKFC
jgi:hypothetical protein